MPAEVKERKDYNPLIEVETFISNEFIPDEEIKIEIHKMVNKIDSIENLKKTKEEIEDRFGKIDENLIIYMYEELFEKIASDLNITKIKQTKNSIEVFIPNEILEKINVSELFMDISVKNKNFRFAMKSKQLIIILDIIKLEKHFVYYLIDLLENIKKHLD